MLLYYQQNCQYFSDIPYVMPSLHSKVFVWLPCLKQYQTPMSTLGNTYMSVERPLFSNRTSICLFSIAFDASKLGPRNQRGSCRNGPQGPLLHTGQKSNMSQQDMSLLKVEREIQTDCLGNSERKGGSLLFGVRGFY